MLAMMVLTGSGLALTPSRTPVFTRWLASEVPPPSAAAAAARASEPCAWCAISTPIAPPRTGRMAVCTRSHAEST